MTTITVTVTDEGGLTATEMFELNVAAPFAPPTITISPAGPGGASDPDDLESGEQPTSFAQQRSALFVFDISFDTPIASPAAADIVLRNLGVNADADMDEVLFLRDDQLLLSGDGLTLTVELDPGQATDGVYQIELLSNITGGDTFTFTGDQTNRFYVLQGDWNGSGAVNIQDFATFAYWFGQPTTVAPDYVDLNGSGGINIQDFAGFRANFGRSVTFPGQASGEQIQAEAELESAIRTFVAPADTNGDGSLTRDDAANVIDELQRNGTREGVGYSSMDTNRDGDVSAKDALYVINRLELEETISQIAGDDSDDDGEAVDQLLADTALF
jgi:hypothetical protein